MEISNGMKKALFILFLIFVPTFYVSAQIPAKILLVPGHDAEVWGTEYGNLKEADMNLVLGAKIFNILKEDPKLEVYITRDSEGYTKEFADYFSNQKTEIISFRNLAKKWMKEKISNGDFIIKEGVPHNTAKEDVSIKLHGINKWANENKIDAVVHIHFNDYHRSNKWVIGDHKGFAIYMPEEQMINSKGSVELAKSIFEQIKTKYITSTYENEKGGLVPDQSLIALGSNSTLLSTVRSVLVEYGYIYRFGNRTMRFKAYDNFADLTAKGIKNYFLEK